MNGVSAKNFRAIRTALEGHQAQIDGLKDEIKVLRNNIAMVQADNAQLNKQAVVLLQKLGTGATA